MFKKLFFSIFILFLFSSTVNASIPSIDDVGAWITIGFSIIVLHLFIVALAYMYANFFTSEELKVWSKNEIIQAVFSIIILSSFIGTFVLINSLAEPFLVQIIQEGVNVRVLDSKGNVISYENKEMEVFCFVEGDNRWKKGNACDSGDYLKVEVNDGGLVCTGPNSDKCNPLFLMARSYLGFSYEKLADLHKMLFRNYALMNSMNSLGFSTSVRTSKQGQQYVFGGGFSMGFVKDGIYINIVESLIMFVQKILLALKFQESVLKFMEYGLAFYLIILGLIFRSIFIFRKFGGLLLSLGICFMFVLPLLYILGWYTLTIPSIQVVMDERFEGGNPSISENWIFIMGIVSTFLFMGSRVLEFFSMTKMITAAIKTVVDVFVLIGQTVMFVEYGLYVNANSPDFYYTNYEKNVDKNIYEYNTIGEIGVLDYISRFLIIALAIPLFNIYIFFAFVRGLSPLLGGDAEIPALGRFL